MRPDWVSIAEAAYRLEDTTENWLDGLLAALAPIFDEGDGIVGGLVRFGPSRYEIENLRTRNTSPDLLEIHAQMHANTPVSTLISVFASGQRLDTVSRATFSHLPGEAERYLRNSRGRYRDGWGLAGLSATGRCVLISAPLRELRSPTPLMCARGEQVAAHLGAGLRLRAAANHVAESPECILSPDGRVLDAQGPARERGARATLREAVCRVDRARTRSTRADPDEALALWEGLVAGRWSLVDRFESDGRRFVVAFRNDPELPDPRGLSRRERQVAEFVGLGASQKEIAYALGLSAPAVSRVVRAALRKLGLATRMELAAFFAPNGLRAHLAEAELAGEPFAFGSRRLDHEAALALLTDSEREVARLLLTGATNAAITASRAVSERTVENQIHAVFTKLGVHSRAQLASKLADQPE